MCHEYMAGEYCRFSDLASLGLFKCLFWAYFGLSRLALNDMPSYLVVFYYYDDFMESLFLWHIYYIQLNPSPKSGYQDSFSISPYGAYGWLKFLGTGAKPSVIVEHWRSWPTIPCRNFSHSTDRALITDHLDDIDNKCYRIWYRFLSLIIECYNS